MVCGPVGEGEDEIMSAPRFTREQKHEIVRRYVSGERTQSISEAFGCDLSYPGRLAGRWGGENAISERRAAIADRRKQTGASDERQGLSGAPSQSQGNCALAGASRPLAVSVARD